MYAMQCCGSKYLGIQTEFASTCMLGAYCYVVLFATTFSLFRSGWSYFGDRINYVEWLYIVFTLLIIPFRVLNHPGQWIVASLAYFLYGLKIFDFIKLCK